MSRPAITLTTVFALVFVFACDSNGVEEPETPAETAEQVSRIIGGSTFAGLPAIGSFIYNGRQHCTGTVIAPKVVLTAAHCVVGYQPSRMRFIVGPSISDPDAVIQTTQFAPHPNYRSYPVTHDIALVALAEEAPVEPLGVVQHMDSSWVGTNLLFVGYGVDNGFYGSGAGIKRAVWIPVSKVDQYSFRYEDPNLNTCAGDSGGPALHRDANGNFLVAGITSWGDQYCRQFGVNERVDPYIELFDLPTHDSEPSTTPPPANQDPCEGETYQGRCDGEVVIWCENDRIHAQDCADSDRVCDYSEGQGYYACLVPPEPVDPCKGETYEGRCDGDVVIWCENEEIRTLDCSERGRICAYSSTQSYYGCVLN